MWRERFRGRGGAGSVIRRTKEFELGGALYNVPIDGNVPSFWYFV